MSLALPEIFLTFTGLLLLIYGVMRGDRSAVAVSTLSVISFAITAAFIVTKPENGLAFHDMFINDYFGRFIKLALLMASGMTVILSSAYLKNTNITKPEYPVFIMFATIGMMLMVSANDLLSLYVGLELQSLTLYILATFRRDDVKSSEAGIKYFVLGALSSCILLYGISLIYGYAGTTNFVALAEAIKPETSAIFGLVFVCSAFAFKISAAPFHMWAPDVFEGSPTPVTAFLTSAPKLAAIALLARVLLQPMIALEHQWTQVIVFASVASMLLGSFAGLAQSNIKRLMAYSAIANVGYALIGLSATNESSLQSLLIYIIIYFVNTLGIFGVILCLRRKGQMTEKISDLAGLSKSHPLLAAGMLIFMFSLAGIPPLAGFFGKYFILLAAIKAGMIPLAIVGVLSSVIAAAYYLRIVKVMYFDEAQEGSIDPVPELSLKFATTFAAILLLGFTIYPNPVIDGALDAARSLLRV